LHNEDYIKKKNIKIGDKVLIQKAGEVIPEVICSLPNERVGGEKIFTMPKRCPVCGAKVERKDSQAAVKCVNSNCPAQKLRGIIHFVSRDAMNIEGLSESGLLKLIGIGAVKSFADLFRMEEHRDEIIGLEGFGKRSFENLTASAERASHTTPARLLYGLGIPGIGVANSNLIAGACRNRWKDIEALDEESLLMIDGVGDVMSRDYVSYFADAENRERLDDLLKELDIDESYEEAGTSLENKVFVITGSLEHYGNRKELKSEIEAEGGKVAGSVSSKTDYLITNDPGSGSTKNRTARELGVAIITEDEVRKMLGH
ncbi:MAG: NAD-dependent DNA ligase LigA, partial [Clostridiales bacterium]|nr:NAD-dependent DNA ligase LigA [Clostridiales bacterium]